MWWRSPDSEPSPSTSGWRGKRAAWRTGTRLHEGSWGLALSCGAFALLTALLAQRPGRWALLWWWPACSALWLMCAYAGAGARLLGKDASGALQSWARLLLLPYHMLMAALRALRRWWTAEPWYHQVAPGLYVGARCPAASLPRDVALVVDLTAEWPCLSGLPATLPYRCLPTLDGSVPKAAQLCSLLDELHACPGPLYVHCAAGHGRSAMVAAGLMVVRGLSPNVEAAVRAMQRVRPQVRLRRRQRQLARQVVQALHLRRARVLDG